MILNGLLSAIYWQKITRIGPIRSNYSRQSVSSVYIVNYKGNLLLNASLPWGQFAAALWLSNARWFADQLTKLGVPIPLIKYLSRLFQFFVRYRGGYKAIQYRRLRVTNPLDTVTNHFEYWSSLDHPNRKSLEMVIGEINGSAANFVETGASAWGMDSTR